MYPPKPLLTASETNLLRELIRGDGGAGNKELACRLGLTPCTVKTYCNNLQGKLGLHSRTALALYAERSGMFRG